VAAATTFDSARCSAGEQSFLSGRYLASSELSLEGPSDSLIHIKGPAVLLKLLPTVAILHGKMARKRVDDMVAEQSASSADATQSNAVGRRFGSEV